VELIGKKRNFNASFANFSSCCNLQSVYGKKKISATFCFKFRNDYNGSIIDKQAQPVSHQGYSSGNV